MDHYKKVINSIVDVYADKNKRRFNVATLWLQSNIIQCLKNNMEL